MMQSGDFLAIQKWRLVAKSTFLSGNGMAGGLLIIINFYQKSKNSSIFNVKDNNTDSQLIYYCTQVPVLYQVSLRLVLIVLRIEVMINSH